MFTFECLRIGKLALRSAPHGAFEILLISGSNLGHTIARVEIDKEEFPTLKVIRMKPQERLMPARSTASVDCVTLASWRDELPTDYELTATGTDLGIDISLKGHCRYRLFWWRVQFELTDGEVLVHGPFMTDSPAS